MTQHAGVHEKGKFNLQTLLGNIKENKSYEKTGAIGIFIGTVRGENNEAQKVQKLTLEAYEEKANEVLDNICNELEKKPSIVDVQIHHLLGDFQVGDEIVYVSVAGGHRPEVFSILREAVERYKHEAPVFKREQIIDEKGQTRETWVSERKTESQQ